MHEYCAPEYQWRDGSGVNVAPPRSQRPGHIKNHHKSRKRKNSKVVNSQRWVEKDGGESHGGNQEKEDGDVTAEAQALNIETDFS
jgi:hypothetical protein